MPPKTPVSTESKPKIFVVGRPSRRAPTPIVARRTTWPTTAATAAAPSFCVRPSATAMAKMRGRLVKIAPPAWPRTLATASGRRPSFALPSPRRRPATGRTETGSMSARPIFWSRAKARRGTFTALPPPPRGGPCTSAAVVASRARTASARQASSETSRTRAFTAGTCPVPTDSSPTPRPRRSGTAARSPASAPQTAAGIPCLRAAAQVRAIRWRTAGSSASARGERRGWPRSIARVNWVRSFVPMVTKSASFRNASARIAAEATSTVIPARRRGAPSRSRSSSRSATALAPLVEHRDHRERHPHVVLLRHPEKRTELGTEEVGPVDEDAQAPLAERRVLLLGEGKPAQRLVAPRVERPHDDRAPRSDRLGHRAVDRLLLLLRRDVGAVEEEELGTEEPDPFGAGGDPLLRVDEASHVRQDGDPRAVLRQRRLGRREAVGAALRRTPLAALADRLPLGVVRREAQLGGVAVEDRERPFGNLERAGVDPGHRGNSHRPGQERGVRRRPARHRAEPGHPSAPERCGLRRGEVLRHDDRALGGRGGRRALPDEDAQDTPTRVPQVGRAGGERRVREAGDPVGVAAHGLAEGPGGALARDDLVLGLGEEERVVEERHVRLEDVGVLAAGLGADARFERSQLDLGFFEREVQVAPFRPLVGPGLEDLGLLAHQARHGPRRAAGGHRDAREDALPSGRDSRGRREGRRRLVPVDGFQDPGEGRERLPRVGTRGAEPHDLAVDDAEREEPDDAPRARHRGPGLHEDLRPEPSRRPREGRRGAGVEAEPALDPHVAHLLAQGRARRDACPRGEPQDEEIVDSGRHEPRRRPHPQNPLAARDDDGRHEAPRRPGDEVGVEGEEHLPRDDPAPLRHARHEAPAAEGDRVEADVQHHLDPRVRDERDRMPRRVDRRDDAVARGEEERRDRVDSDAVAEEAVGEDRVGDPVDRYDRARQRRLQRERRLGGSGGGAAWRSFVHGSGKGRGSIGRASWRPGSVRGARCRRRPPARRPSGRAPRRSAPSRPRGRPRRGLRGTRASRPGWR